MTGERALVYVEVDIDYCDNNYGFRPCQANLAGVSVVASQVFDFSQGSVNSFTASEATLTGAVGGALFEPTGDDPILRRTGLSFSGSTERYIEIDVERVSARSGGAVWQGTVFYSTGGHPESASFYKNFTEVGLMSVGDRKAFVLDMSELTVGGTDWISNTITGVRFDFDDGQVAGSNGSGDFRIHSIGIGRLATASDATGTAKCFNSLKTCQDRVNFLNAPVTLRFAEDTSYLPDDIEAFPMITSVSFQPATISLGKDLGQRATLTIGFRDRPHSDTGPGFDKYYAERDYNPFTQGSFWGKFRARQPYLKGRPLRLIRGYLGDTLEDMETRHYIIESFNGPTPKGEYTLVAKDVLKLADGDRAQAPLVSNGFLVAAIDTNDSELTLSPNGIGDEEYPSSGYVAIGGEEILGFVRLGGIDANTLLMLHLDGPDESSNAADFIDSSPSSRTASLIGGTNLDTEQFVFGGCSSFFDGSGDGISFPDDDAWSFSGDFTIEAYVRVTNNFGTVRSIVTHGADASNMWTFRITTSTELQFIVVDGGSNVLNLISGTGLFSLDTWYHVAVVRNGNVFKLYRNGVELATTTSAFTFPNESGLLRIGVQPNNTNEPMHGWIDEVRISNVARWTDDFTVQGVRYTDPDTLTVTRGQLGTTAASHDVQDRVQLVLRYDGEDPSDIIYDLFVNYAFIPASYINLVDWQNETGSFLQRLYGAVIPEPTDVSKLVSELIEQAALAMWWDDEFQLVRMKVLRAISTDAAVYDDETILEGTLSVTEQPNLRASQIWTYYGVKNSLRPLDEPDNFRSTLATVNLQAESDEGQPAIVKIFSRWIPAFGRDTAERLNDIQLGRFQIPPRRFQFEVFRTNAMNEPILGSGYQVGAYSLQDEFGAPVRAPIQITRLNPLSEKFSIEAEEMLFEQLDPADLVNRTIIIDSNILNVNLRTIHDGIYPEPVAFESPSITVTCIIETGVIVGSANEDLISFDIGAWPGGVSIHLVVNGQIRGAGGAGGFGGNANGNNSIAEKSGIAGGTALYTRYPITLEDATGIIYGGGGGGGGGDFRGGGGGGGAGFIPGDGGLRATSQNDPTDGSPGTQDAGGAGGDGGGSWDADGGVGGSPGQAGQDGQNGAGTGTQGIGGAAGHAIDGISFVTQVGSVGSRLGGQVN